VYVYIIYNDYFVFPQHASRRIHDEFLLNLVLTCRTKMNGTILSFLFYPGS
jgi:hypothetical protein